MKLALRATPPTDGTWYERAFAALTRWRLCSQWVHGGIVIDDTLYQANARHGLHATTDWTPERWLLLELGDAREAEARQLFAQHAGAGYDYLGVLGFALPVRGRDDRLYCFEWCALAMGLEPARWMTPERLLWGAR